MTSGANALIRLPNGNAIFWTAFGQAPLTARDIAQAGLRWSRSQGILVPGKRAEILYDFMAYYIFDGWFVDQLWRHHPAIVLHLASLFIK